MSPPAPCRCSRTFSHSTLFVDEGPQARVRTARLRSGARWAHGVLEDAYPDVRLERRLRLAAPYLLLEDDFRSPQAHRYGWALHVYGSLAVESPAGEPPDGAPPALPPLPEDGPFEWTAGHTPGNPVPDRRGTLVLRAVGRTRRFRGALEVHHGAPALDAPPEALFAGRPFAAT